MLEWLEVRLDVRYGKILLYEYRIELLNSDRDALKQECHLACIAGSGNLPPTHISEKIQRRGSYYPSTIGTERNCGETGIFGLLPRDGKCHRLVPLKRD